MATSYLVMLVYIANCFINAESLKCIRCNSLEYDSPCRLGTDTTEFECPDHEKACYAEYFFGGDEPLYRRGCSVSDWCRIQKGQHGADLKYCKTCEGEKCNVDIIGAPDSSNKIQCYSCVSQNNLDTDCMNGGIDYKMKLCKRGINKCFYSATSADRGTRGCGTDDYCSSLSSKYGDLVNTCEYCHDDLCNTQMMKVHYD